MHKVLTYVTPIALAVALVATSASAQTTTGEIKPTTQLLANSCAACHGTDGNSPGAIGKLSNMKTKKFVEKMKKYKYEEGRGRIMGPIHRGISDDQIQALAEYFQAINRQGKSS